MPTWRLKGGTLEARQGDITRQNTGAVVNAANKELAPGGGVAGAIHRAAGPQLTEHCRERGRCGTGEAVITPGFDLTAEWIVHTVGPVYEAHPNPPEALRASYENSLRRAREKDVQSISFPLLSTGAFGYPAGEASRVAVEAFRDFLETGDTPGEIRMVLFGEEDLDTFVEVAREVLGPPDSPDEPG